MECLKILHELSLIAQRMETPSLKHFFKTFDPATNKNLALAITQFHLGDLESSDYRSAYHQLCDWFYGWNVTDATDYSRGNSAMEHFKMKRVPREINLAEQGERIECERIIMTYEMLFILSRRALKRHYIELEELLPRIGKGLGTMTHSAQKETEDDGLDVDKEDVWKQAKVDQSEDVGGEFLGDHDNLDDSIERLNRRNGDGLVVRRGSKVPKDKHKKQQRRSKKKKNSAAEAIGEAYGDFNEHEVEGDEFRNGDENDEQIGEDRDDESNTSLDSSFSEIDEESPKSTAPEQEKETASPSPTDPSKKNMIGELPTQGYQFMKQGGLKQMTTNGLFREGPTEFDLKRSLQKDINHIYAEIYKSFDFTMACISTTMLIMSFSEMLGDKETYKKCISQAHDLSDGFVSNTLKTIWDLLNKELQCVTLQDLRDPERFKNKINEVIALREVDGKTPQFKFRRLNKKFVLVHELFTAFDIFLFPNFVAAHRENTKACHFSAFDSSLWLSGGYDSVIRIHDIRPSSNHILLSQYVGHKSIVTDVHFTRDDKFIVSSSFDRTIKIWNSQSAACERTLTGHLDSVTSCDVTPDSRFVASSSIDSTVRVWDFNTGECLAVIKKHTRWVKIARFSVDGRYLITAGLESRIYIWDLKILVNSRTISHTRSIEAHSDHVLDLATARPTLLLTTSRDSTVKLFDFLTGHEHFSINLAPSWACTVCFSQNAEYFATGSFDNNVILFKTKTGERVRNIRVLNLGILCVRFPRDLKYLIVGTAEGFLQQIPL